MSAEWIKRRYIPSEDEDAVLYLWAKSYARSRYGRARGADKGHTQTERVYWADQAPTIEALLNSADVEVVCDPERVTTTEAGPAVLWGFACTSGDTVHYVCVKRHVAAAGIGGDIVRDLLGSRLERACGYTHELVEMLTGACGVRLPRDWYSDSTYIARKIIGSRKVAAEDECVRSGKKVA